MNFWPHLKHACPRSLVCVFLCLVTLSMRAKRFRHMGHSKGCSCAEPVGDCVLSGVGVLRAGVLNAAARLLFDDSVTLCEGAEPTEDRFPELEGRRTGVFNGVDCCGDG